MELHKNKKITYCKGPISIINHQSSIVNYKAGFTLIEMIIVLAIIVILATLAYSTLRTPKEKIVCKNIFSAMQLAKMRAVATGYNTYVDFDMNGGSVSNNFYTVYLDTDNDKAFGEKNNANGDNEFTESHFAMQDTLGGYPGVALPGGVDFGLPITNPPSLTPTGYAFSPGVLSDGVSFAGGSNRIKFLPKGRPSGFGGSVYVYNTDDSIRGCTVVMALTGIIRMWTWDGSKWN